MSEVGFTLKDGGILPVRSDELACGADIHSNEDLEILAKSGPVMVSTGVYLSKCPDDIMIEVRGRSGLASNGIMCHVGTVDPNYRGEIKVVLYSIRDEVMSMTENREDGNYFSILRGQRIAQLVFVPIVRPKMIECPPEKSERGENGFGSTGLKRSRDAWETAEDLEEEIQEMKENGADPEQNQELEEHLKDLEEKSE